MSVALAFLHANTVTTSFMISVYGVVGYERSKGRAVDLWPIRSGPLGLPKSRNFAVEKFLTSEHEWLWFVDSDMGFHANTLENLGAVASECDRRVVGALCMCSRDAESDGMGGHRIETYPSIFVGREFKTPASYAENSLIKVAGTGTACLLIHRTVVEGWTGWFDLDPDTVGEDLAFCRRLGARGTPIYVHTGIKTTHYKHTWLKG